MRTILSRVRRYKFLQRDAETERQIVSRVFHTDIVDDVAQGHILNYYFQKFLPAEFVQIKTAALDFWHCVFGNYAQPNFTKLRAVKNFIETKNMSELKTNAQIINSLDKGKNPAVFKILLEQIIAVLQNTLSMEYDFTARDIQEIRDAAEAITKWKSANGIYNISELAILESIAMEIAK